jgi:LysR family glycine cleavage system transcriptional activator
MSRLTPSSLNLLRAFEAAARLGSFRLASNELCVTASAVSQQVKALEAQLGIALFARQPRALLLTDAGKRYASEIRPHLAALEEISRRLCSTHPRTLRVTMMPPLASRVVLPRLADFRAANPQIELHIDTRIAEVDLTQRQVDLAVRSGTPPWPGCAHEKLVDLYAQVICPPSLATLHSLQSNPLRLTEIPLVHMTSRPDSWPRFFAQLGLPAPAGDAYYVDDYPAAIEAASTLGAALAVMPLEKPLIASGRVVAIGPALGPLPEAVYAVMPSGQQDAPLIRLFIAWLQKQLAELN